MRAGWTRIAVKQPYLGERWVRALRPCHTPVGALAHLQMVNAVTIMQGARQERRRTMSPGHVLPGVGRVATVTP